MKTGNRKRKDFSIEIVEVPGLFGCNRTVYTVSTTHKEIILPESTLNTTSSVINILYDYCPNFSGTLTPSYYTGLNKLVEVHFYRQGTRTTEL